MHFRVTEKFTTHCVSYNTYNAYNNAGLISKASEIAENCRCRRSHSHLTPLPQGTFAYIGINLTSPEKLESLAYVVAADSNFCGGLQQTHLFCNRVRHGHSRSFKVVDFGINRKGVCDFLLVINCNFGPILHRFWDTTTYWLKIANFFLPHSNLTPSLGMNPLLPKLESLGSAISWS